MHITDDFCQWNASLSIVLGGARRGSAIFWENMSWAWKAFQRWWLALSKPSRFLVIPWRISSLPVPQLSFAFSGIGSERPTGSLWMSWAADFEARFPRCSPEKLPGTSRSSHRRALSRWARPPGTSTAVWGTGGWFTQKLAGRLGDGRVSRCKSGSFPKEGERSCPSQQQSQFKNHH